MRIDTLDNPRWRVQIDLVGTSVEKRPFTEIRDVTDKIAWPDCRVREGKFEGHGGPLILEQLLRVFLS